MRVAAILAAVVVAVCCRAQEGQSMTPWTELYRVPIPDELPAHPRVFCTADDIARIRADYAAGDDYTRVCVDGIVATAQRYMTMGLSREGRPKPQDFHRAAILAEAWALTDDERLGRGALELLRWAADVCPTLETTGSRGRFTSSTLLEGPLAVNASMAWDLIADAPFVSDEDRAHIEEDLLRVLAWECGHRCGHRNSSNWRSWALAVLASCGFAIGDRDLIDEAINGAWDEERNCYLYGIVQQLTHSVFADGIHWERSMGYHFYTMSALMYVLMAAENSGIDLWSAELPGILQPFEGGAGHDEFGPPGPRSVKYMLDAPFYYAFPDFSFACINDSGMRRLSYHRIYEIAWRHYRDPKYAWLISRRRSADTNKLPWWNVWRPAGEPEAGPVGEAHSGETAWRLRTEAGERVALVQNVQAPANQPVLVSGWVKAIQMDGGSAHIRCNTGGQATFTNRVTEAGDWTQVQCTVQPDTTAPAGALREIRLHVFLEDGAGEVLWDDITVKVKGSTANLIRNAGFEQHVADGRDTDFWSLVHAAPDVPQGHFSLAEDATIGLVGRHERGCTNFPVGGFTILRADADDESAPAVNLTWGPYGSGHDHPDRLSFVFYGRGAILCPDAGSWGYDNPMHLTWANQTIAHNTLTVDEVSQYPQGTSDSIWASERGGREVYGVQHIFHAGESLKAVRVTCNTAYEGVNMDRTLCLVDEYLLDVFRATSMRPHTYDLALHAVGRITTDAALEPAPPGWLGARGYAHLTDVRRAPLTSGLNAVFDNSVCSLLTLHQPLQNATIIVGTDPVKDGGPARTALISRSVGPEATWVTVLEPYSDHPRVSSLAVEPGADALTVTVKHSGGTDVFVLPVDPGAPLLLRRMNDRAEVTSTEQAIPVQ